MPVLLNRCSKGLTSPSPAGQDKAVRPRLSLWLMSTPGCRSNVEIAMIWPPPTAQKRSVKPELSGSSGSQSSCFRMAAMRSKWPFPQAKTERSGQTCLLD